MDSDSDLSQFLESLEAVETVEMISNQGLLKRPRVYRARADDFGKYDEKDFFMRYRLSKQSVLYLLEKIEHCLEFKDDK